MRKATLHLLGDRDGYIPSPLLQQYAGKLAGFDKIWGAGRQAGEGRLSISAQAQTAALQALGSYKGTIGVYNYRTGEILCAVSTPTYDPDQVPDISQDQTGQYDGVYVNRFFGGAFVPGSIFKLVTAAAALETLEDVTQRQFICQGSADVAGGQVICTAAHGTMDFSQALAKSCNVTFGSLAAEIGEKTMGQYADRLGLTASVTVDGFVTPAGTFDGGEDALALEWSGVGQGKDLINPCSFLRFLGIIAGGGEGAEPYLMAEIRQGKKTIYQAKTKSTGRLLSAQTAEQLRQMMQNNVETVYGQAPFGQLTVCAKSGTAEVEGQTLPNATFAGFVADENYPLAFLIVAQDAGSGSQVCTGMAASVLKACTAVLDQERGD